MTWMELISSIISSSALTGLGTYLVTRQKQALTGDEQIRQAYQKILADERKENHMNDTKVTELTCRIEQLITENAALKMQIQNLEVQLDTIKELFEEHCASCPMVIKDAISSHKVIKK